MPVFIAQHLSMPTQINQVSETRLRHVADIVALIEAADAKLSKR